MTGVPYTDSHENSELAMLSNAKHLVVCRSTITLPATRLFTLVQSGVLWRLKRDKLIALTATLIFPPAEFPQPDSQERHRENAEDNKFCQHVALS